MKRRTFLKLAGFSLWVYGCGSDNEEVASNPQRTDPNLPFPELGRISSQDIFGFDEAGNLYLVRPRTGQVERLDSQGQVVWSSGERGIQAGQLNTPVALAVDSQQRVWVLDRGLARLQRFDAQGNLEGDFAEGILNLPQDVVFDGTNLLVSDAGNQRVAVLNLNGLLVEQFGPPRLNFPRGLGLDGEGRVHVVDSGASRIAVFSSGGDFQTFYGGSGTNAAEFIHARGLAIRTQDGLIAIADGIARDIEFFSPELNSLGHLVTPDLQPVDLTFGPDGQLFVHGEQV